MATGTNINKRKGDVLIVDDTPANLNLLFALLSNNGYKVRAAISGMMALKSVFSALPELILLDINMPEMNGFEVCRQLKADQRTHDIPIIFISASDETDDKVRAFETGGVDYVTKPFQVEEVLARVSTQLALYQQQRELEEFRQREIAYLRELSEMKDEFVQTVSHDLKNPLGVIMGYADLLSSDKVLKEHQPLLGYVDGIQKGAKQMLGLITNLLDLAKIEAGMGLGMAPMNLHNFLSDQVNGIKMLADNKQISLTYTPPPAHLTLMADEMRLGQVIKNLLSNAVKYTPDCGKIALEAETGDTSVIIRVIDNGMGIPGNDLPHVFDKFYRVDRKEHRAIEGTGLGLSISKAVVQQHQGNIWVESELGEGSIFNIELPLNIDVGG